MKYLGIAQILLATAILAATIEAAVLKHNPNRARGGGPGRGRRVVKKLRKNRNGKQLFGSRVPIFPAAPIIPPAPILRPAPLPFAAPVFGPPVALPFAAPVFGPPVAPIPQPLRLIELKSPPPPPAPVVIIQKAPEPSYLAPSPAPAPLPAPANAIIELRNEPASSLYTVPKTAASERVAVVAAGPPIGTIRSVYNAPGSQPGVNDWNYEFETENGIKQSAVGEMKDIGDSIVMVMRGSYEYIGSDTLTYVVDWVADENGFRASAPHLPKNVPIPFPEIQAAVDAQIRFAAEEDRLRAAGSSPVASYGAPAPTPIVEVRAPVATYGAPEPAAIVEVRAPVAAYGAPEPAAIVEVRAPATDYGLPTYGYYY